MASNVGENVDSEINSREIMKFMIRPCKTYKDEYDECTSLKGRFQQYFVYGSSIDCNNWRRDYELCLKVESNADDEASFNELLENERVRRQDRLLPHLQNNTWQKRTHPPEEWDKPLPDWLQKENENTYLALKAEEIKNSPRIPTLEERTLCVIL